MNQIDTECSLPRERDWTDPIVWTHGLFVLNAALWLGVGNHTCAFFLGLSTVASTAYHRSHEQDWMWAHIDRFLAVLTLLITLGMTAPHMSVGDTGTAFGLLAAALACKECARRDSYDSWHSAWHVLIALGQAFLSWVYWTGTA